MRGLIVLAPIGNCRRLLRFGEAAGSGWRMAQGLIRPTRATLDYFEVYGGSSTKIEFDRLVMALQRLRPSDVRSDGKLGKELKNLKIQ